MTLLPLKQGDFPFQHKLCCLHIVQHATPATRNKVALLSTLTVRTQQLSWQPVVLDIQYDAVSVTSKMTPLSTSF